jgi:hypothetical protein
MLTQGICLATGFVLGVLLMRRPDRRSEHVVTFDAVCKYAKRLGVDAGHDLYELEALAGPPSAYTFDPKFNPDAPPYEREAATWHAAMVAYSQGRADGWWESANHEATIGVKELADYLREQA